jgi:DNA-binding MarR family transcriptional regulator
MKYLIGMASRMGDEAIRSDWLMRLLQEVRRLHVEVEEYLDEALAPLGLTSVTWRALETLIASRSELTLSELASRLECGRPNATQLVDRMAAAGLVKRVGDRTDRRIVRVRATHAGSDRFEQGLPIVLGVQSDVLRPFSPGEVRELRQLLERLLRIWQEPV